MAISALEYLTRTNAAFRELVNEPAPIPLSTVTRASVTGIATPTALPYATPSVAPTSTPLILSTGVTATAVPAPGTRTTMTVAPTAHGEPEEPSLGDQAKQILTDLLGTAKTTLASTVRGALEGGRASAASAHTGAQIGLQSTRLNTTILLAAAVVVVLILRRR